MSNTAGLINRINYLNCVPFRLHANVWRRNHINVCRLVLAVSLSCPLQTRTTCPQTFETEIHRIPFTVTKGLDSLMSWTIQHETPKIHRTILIIPILRRRLPVRPTKRRMLPCMMKSLRRVELGIDIQAFLLFLHTLQARLQECRLVCVIYPNIFSVLTRVPFQLTIRCMCRVHLLKKRARHLASGELIWTKAWFTTPICLETREDK